MLCGPLILFGTLYIQTPCSDMTLNNRLLYGRLSNLFLSVCAYVMAMGHSECGEVWYWFSVILLVRSKVQLCWKWFVANSVFYYFLMSTNCRNASELGGLCKLNITMCGRSFLSNMESAARMLVGECPLLSTAISKLSFLILKLCKRLLSCILLLAHVCI